MALIHDNHYSHEWELSCISQDSAVFILKWEFGVNFHSIIWIEDCWVIDCCAVLNRVQLSAAPWTVAHQAPLSMGFPRQEFWSGLPFPTSFLIQGQNRFASPALPGGSFTTSATWEIVIQKMLAKQAVTYPIITIAKFSSSQPSLLRPLLWVIFSYKQQRALVPETRLENPSHHFRIEKKTFLSWKSHLLVMKMIQNIFFLTSLYWFPGFLFYCTITGPGTENILLPKHKRISSQGIASIPRAVPHSDPQSQTIAGSVPQGIQVAFLCGQSPAAQKTHWTTAEVWLFRSHPSGADRGWSLRTPSPGKDQVGLQSDWSQWVCPQHRHVAHSSRRQEGVLIIFFVKLHIPAYPEHNQMTE